MITTEKKKISRVEARKKSENMITTEKKKISRVETDTARFECGLHI